VIAADQRSARRFVSLRCVESLDGGIELEKQRAARVVAHEALHPEKARDARAARDRTHLVKARCGIDDRMAGGQLLALQPYIELRERQRCVIAVRKSASGSRRAGEHGGRVRQWRNGCTVYRFAASRHR
jgi:hypothetical protein